MLIAPSGRADPTSAPGETAEGVFGEGTTGYGQPDSKTGAMTWTYPFNLPAARGRPQPQLTLSYNSSSHDREAGYGWGLDLPVIELKPLSGNPCFNKQDGTPIACWTEHLASPPVIEERYTFNGQPLVFICQLPGSEEVCGEKEQPEWASSGGWRYFRLQVEGQFSRFYLSGNRRYWRVQLKGGDLLEFGEPPNSRTLGIEHAFGNINAILRWRLVRHSDFVHKVSGAPVNYIDYRWKQLGKRGLLYLTDIYDTPRANGPGGDADFAHHTQLTWQSPEFLQTFYADPYRATPDLRVSRVAVASMPWSSSGPREVIRTYLLGYAPAQGATSTVALSQVFQLWHHSFLNEIVMEGRCNQFEDDQGNIPQRDRECPSRLPPTTFEYEDGSPTFEPFGITQFSEVQGGPPNAVDENRVLPYLNSVGVVDFNRDGLPDIVQSWDAEFCPGEGKHEDAIHETITIAPNNMTGVDKDTIVCVFKTNVGVFNEVEGRESRPILSSRPITGYLNRGLDSLNVQLEYQCMDAGRIDDTTGLTHYNAERKPGFFTNAAATTLVGSWSEGVAAWSNAQYAPYRARSLLPDYDLKLMPLNSALALPAAGKGLVVVTKIDGFYYVRIFNWAGNKVIDKGKNEFLPNEVLVQQLDVAFDTPSIDDQTKRELRQDILSSLGYALPFEPGTGCDADHFKETDFHPGWKWEQAQLDVDWARLPPNETDPSRQHLQPRWFADIDGDGLVDRLVGNGEAVGDFDPALVEYTSLYGKGERSPGNVKVPAEIPFVWNADGATSWAPTVNPPPKETLCGSGPGSDPPPSVGKRTGIFGCEYYTRFFYVDINGDGLVDLVTYNPAAYFPPRVRPGDGKGHFACDNSKQPWQCLPPDSSATPAYEIEIKGPPNLWNVNDEEVYFHDVTGDGLADIVKYDKASGEIRVWVNQDGHTFACVTANCVVGKTLNAHAATHGLTGSAAFNIGDHRTTFADMNADGIDDIVFLAKEGAYVGTFMKKYQTVPGFERGAAPRPGLLTRIHNGYGATTDIRYNTIQELDLAVKDTAFAWQFHSPVVESVVTSIVTQDSYDAGGDLNDPQISAPYQFKRKAQYLYQNPAYDRWSRSFAGFRKVVAHYGDEKATTVTTYWFGPCQNNKLGALLPGSQYTPLCPEGSDDDDYKSLTGRVVRIDRGNELLSAFSAFAFPLGLSRFTLQLPQVEGPKLLWTKTFQHSHGALFGRPDGDRRVMFSYPSQIDTYLYDDAQPTQPGGEFPTLVAGGDPRENAPHQKDIRKHLSRLVEYDNWGSLKRVTDKGSVYDVGDSKPSDVADAITITLFSPKKYPFDSDGPNNSADTPAVLPCTSDWQCLPDFVSIWKPQPLLGDKLLRKSHFTYTATGDIQSIEGWLDVPSQPLDRHHPAGNNSIAPKPPGQSLDNGWHTVATLNYDTWGNVTRTIGGYSLGGAPPSCTTIDYDNPYQQLPNVVANVGDGCAGSALETQSVFDRGFEQVVSSIAPNGGSSEIHYDPFGRPIEFYLPNPDAAAGTQILAATIAYSDRKPLSHVDVRRIVGPGTSTRSVTIMNGLGEPVVAFDQGDNNDWVLNGWKETNLTGQVEKIRRPWAFIGDPVATAVNSNFIPVPPDNSLFEIRYDGFGRKVSATESGAGFSQELMRTSYFPLALETRDAEQFKPGGAHDKSFQRVEFDGRGRSTRSVAHIGNPTTADIITSVTYNPTGEPVAIARTHAGSTYRREMEFDTLGRLMVNKEPNTGNNWRYVWDDAGRLVGTSDARGCGVNFHYDGLGRLIGEDYSPCLASQPPHTAPNLATGEGLETFYRYDAYETGQVSPEPNFKDDARFAQGNLVSVQDRGSYTRFNYDDRGRVRRISRQIANPEGLNLPSRYAPHWFTSRLDYDLGDRLTRRTTGADVPELLMSGGSEERYAYSPRGQLSGIDSSYGAIVKSMVYDPDGVPRRIVYGDVRGTTANFTYDSRRRLTQYLLGVPSISIFSLPVEHFDYRFSAYDDVGNPLTIEDRRVPLTPGAALPPEASPVKMRKMQYDDLYRLTRIDSAYDSPGGIAPWSSPFEAEIATGDRHPVPLRRLPTRVKQQTFDYDGLGNLTASSDDLSARYDRSLGPNLGYGTPLNGPNQLWSGEGLQVRYDQTGNLSELKIERPGTCPTGAADQCAQWFAYDWDEVGQLARARRWDFDGNALPLQASPDALPAEKPSWDVTYAYAQGARVRKSVTDTAGLTRHTLEVFDTLRVEQAPFDATDGNYRVRRNNVHAYPGGMAHVFWDGDGQLPHQAPDSLITMNLVMGDYLGSSSVVINHATSELVERTTYQPYGAVESDYRPSKWKAFREPYKFTGKEEDIEVGATYFGARYYQPYLGRFMSADPLTIQGLGSDLNPYAYVGGRVMTQVDPFGLQGCEPNTMCMPEGQPEDVIVGRRPVDEKAATAEAMASQATTRQPTFVRERPPLVAKTDTDAYLAAAEAKRQEEYKTEKSLWLIFLEYGSFRLDWYLFGQPIQKPFVEISEGAVPGPPAALVESTLGRAATIHKAAGGVARFRNLNPTVVLETLEGERLVARGPTRQLTLAQRQILQPAETMVKMRPDTAVSRGIRIHPDIRILVNAYRQGLTPRVLAVEGQIFCPLCAETIEAFGGELVSPSAAVFPFP